MNKKYRKEIKKFEDEYFFLSNFYEADDFQFEYDGLIWKSSEACFQAMKTMDREERERISKLDPGAAKKAGRKVNLRDDWESIKDSMMAEILEAKFSQNPELKNKLIELHDCYLEEGNWWGDKYWGVYNGTGKNKLGKALMALSLKLHY